MTDKHKLKYDGQTTYHDKNDCPECKRAEEVCEECGEESCECCPEHGATCPDDCEITGGEEYW